MIDKPVWKIKWYKAFNYRIVWVLCVSAIYAGIIGLVIKCVK